MKHVGASALILGGLLPAVADGQQREEGDSAAEPAPPARIEAEPPPSAAASDDPWERWKSFKQNLIDSTGTTVSLNIDIVGRSGSSGPQTDQHKAIGRYDLLIRQQVTDDSLVSLDLRGGWGQGLDPRLGLFANTDQYAQTNEDIFVLHLYYQHLFLDDQLTVRAGKFDIGDWIDTNRYGYYNFLGYSFAHNATIPLTGNTLGVMASYEPTDSGWYIAGGISNSTQTPTESGLRTTFNGEADWLSIAEVGFKPVFDDRKGVYRFTTWHNGRPFQTTDGSTDAGAVGFALSFDQDLTDRLGAYVRFGVADGDPFEPKRYYSAGLHLTEPIPGRTRDTLVLGVVINEFTDDHRAALADARSAERYVELYYNWQLTEWAQLQPVLQIVDNPGGRDDDTAVIAGLHLALRF